MFLRITGFSVIIGKKGRWKQESFAVILAQVVNYTCVLNAVHIYAYAYIYSHIHIYMWLERYKNK